MKKVFQHFVLVFSSFLLMLPASSSAAVSYSSTFASSTASISPYERDGMVVPNGPLSAPQLNYQPTVLGAPDFETLMTLTPRKYKQMTGKRLGFIKSMELKLVQKQLKKQQKAEGGGGLPKWAYIVMSFFVLGWLAIGIQSNFTGNDWWISLLLYLLFYLPGLIYSLIVMKKYY